MKEMLERREGVGMCQESIFCNTKVGGPSSHSFKQSMYVCI